jgi:hypothetical protein
LLPHPARVKTPAANRVTSQKVLVFIIKINNKNKKC